MNGRLWQGGARGDYVLSKLVERFDDIDFLVDGEGDEAFTSFGFCVVDVLWGDMIHGDGK